MAAEPAYARGDIWTVDLRSNPTDPEQAFERPALLVSNDRLHRPNLRMVIVVPGTPTQRSLPLDVSAEPDARLRERIGRLDAMSGAIVDDTLRNALALG